MTVNKEYQNSEKLIFLVISGIHYSDYDNNELLVNITKNVFIKTVET